MQEIMQINIYVDYHTNWSNFTVNLLPYAMLSRIGNISVSLIVMAVTHAKLPTWLLMQWNNTKNYSGVDVFNGCNAAYSILK